MPFWDFEDLLFSRAPFDHPSGVSRLQALFRTRTADRNLKSEAQYFDDTDGWFYHNSMGFFLDLGIQTNYDSQYPRSAMSGSPETTRDSPDPGGLEAKAVDVDWRQHDVVLAFRN